MDEYGLSAEQVSFYRANGYIQLLNLLSAEELAETRAALDDANSMILDSRHHTSGGRPEYERIFVQKVNLWTVHAGMRKYVFNPKLAGIARLLAGSDRIRLWHDHAALECGVILAISQNNVYAVRCTPLPLAPIEQGHNVAAFDELAGNTRTDQAGAA